MRILPTVRRRSYEQARRNRLFLEALGSVRESKGISQDRVAQLLGVTPEWVSELESGVINPTIQRLHSYAVAIGVSIDYDVKDLDEQDTTFGWDGSLNTGEKKRIKDNA